MALPITADINTAHAGLEFFPMKKVELVNGSGEVVKEYSVGNYYVTDTVIESKMMTMTRVERQADGSFVDALEDHIVSSSADESGHAGLTTKTTSRKETETYLTVGSALSTSSAPKVIRSRETIQEGTASVKLEASGEREELYYVYAKGKLYDVCTAINTAVKTADENLGVVVDGNLQNIWERGNKVTKLTLDTSTFPDVIRNGSMDVAAIEEGTAGKPFDLSGCTLDSVLYYVSEGTPVLAKTPITDQTPQGIVIIAGYDEYNTILMNPGETETSTMESTTALLFSRRQQRLYDFTGIRFPIKNDKIPANGTSSVCRYFLFMATRKMHALVQVYLTTANQSEICVAYLALCPFWRRAYRVWKMNRQIMVEIFHNE